MKTKILLALFLGFLQFTVITAHASVVVFDEGSRASGFSIATLNGVEMVELWTCTKDQWVKDMNECKRERDLIPVKDLKQFVKTTALFFARNQTKADLAPLRAEQLQSLVQASDFMQDATNVTAISGLSEAKNKLEGASKMVANAPDSQFYQKQQADFQKHYNDLTDLSNQMDQAKQTFASLDAPFNDITQTLIDFIRKDSKDGSPQTVMSEMMKNTLLLNVFHRLSLVNGDIARVTGKASTVVLGANKISALANGSDLWIGYNDSSSTSWGAELTCDPVTVANSKNIYVVYSTRYGITIKQTTNTSGESTISEAGKFTGLISVSATDDDITIEALSDDSTVWTRTVSLKKNGNPASVNAKKWNFAY